MPVKDAEQVPLSLQKALLICAAMISASIVFIGRWQISAIGFQDSTESPFGTEAVYRLDRWTGEIDRCDLQKASRYLRVKIECSAFNDR
jgi:hypothetical protein